MRLALRQLGWLGRGVLVAAALLGTLTLSAACRRRPALTRARVAEVVREEPSLVLAFMTGPDNPQIACQDWPPSCEEPEEYAVASKAGWLTRPCEGSHFARRLTEEGRRRSTVWGRSGDSPLRPREPENPEELTSWFVTAARFERAGDIEILPQPDSNGYPRAKVVLHGRWKPTDDGLVLRQAGFAKVDERTWEQDWVYWHGAWMPEHAAGE